MDSDELIAGWVEKVWDGQDWDDSRLRDYLLYEYWSPHIGLCTLSGFDYRTCDKGDNSAPSQFQFISTLCPSSFMSYKNENSEAEEQLLTRMNEDIDRLRGFWENSGKDIEGGKCKTADFIKWALSIPFHPHWLRWAIERKLYIPEQEADKTTKDLQAGATVPGKMPNTTIGKLAIKAAWEIECATGKQATANEVINKLQEWEPIEPILTEKTARGVKWETTGGIEKTFDVNTCAKALGTWNKSRA